MLHSWSPPPRWALPLTAAAHLLTLGSACEKQAAPASGSGPTAGASSSAGASGGAASGGGPRTYTLYFTAQKTDPVGGVTVELSPPSSWTETVDPMGGPSYGGNGLGHGPDVVLVPMAGEPKERVDKLISRHYDATALAGAERKAAGDGSVWVASRRADGYVDARRFVAAPGDNGVVVCVVTLTPEEAPRLEELERVCATLRVR